MKCFFRSAFSECKKDYDRSAGAPSLKDQFFSLREQACKGAYCPLGEPIKKRLRGCPVESLFYKVVYPAIGEFWGVYTPAVGTFDGFHEEGKRISPPCQAL